MASVAEELTKALPSLSESDFNNLLTHLATWGLKEHSDLQFLSIEDIEGVIPPVAVRRLMYYLKTTGKNPQI